jgi:hypothetical protein
VEASFKEKGVEYRDGGKTESFNEGCILITDAGDPKFWGEPTHHSE